MGLTSRIKAFRVQRYINTYEDEALSAIIPGIALQELWHMMSLAERALVLVSGFVVITGLLGMLGCLLTGLQARRREMAILRAVGAKPAHIFFLLTFEASLLTFMGITLGVLGMFTALGLAAPYIQQVYGIAITLSSLTSYEWNLVGIVQLAGCFIGIIPAVLSYKHTLADGMSVRT